MRSEKDESDRFQRAVEPLDFSPSSGQIGGSEKNYDPSAPRQHDGHSETQTIFYPEEGEGAIDYEKLAKINDGLYDNEDRQRRTSMDRQRDLKIFSKYVDLEDDTRHTASELLAKIEDPRRYRPADAAIFAVITLAANQHDRRIRCEDDYNDLREQCNVSKKHIRKARKKLRENL